jgi:streptogramin lyase
MCARCYSIGSARDPRAGIQMSRRHTAPGAIHGLARIASRSALLATSIAVVFGTGSAAAEPLGTVRHFSTGLTSGEVPQAIASGPEGNMWFTEIGAHPAIGRITPTGTITQFSSGLNTTAELGGIALGPDGNMWFTEAGTHPAIGRITPTGAITEFSSGLNHPPEAIAAGPDGNMWFTEPAGAIGRITPAGQIAEYAAGLNSESSPVDIAAGPEGSLWFTDQGKTRAIGRIAPGSGHIEEFSKGLRYVGGESRPNEIAAGPEGDMWFTDAAEKGALIGRISPSDPVPIKEFPSGLERVTAIAAGPEGDLWFSGLKEYNPETELPPALVQINTEGKVERSIENLVRGDYVSAIAAGPDGNMWFAEQLSIEPTVPEQAIGVLGVGAPAALQAGPTAAGSGQAGSPLTCQGATFSPWAGPEPSLGEFPFDGYRWLLGGSAIPGQSSQSFTPPAADVGGQVSCSVTVTYPLLAVTASATSAAVTLSPAPPSPIVPPAPLPMATVKLPRQTDRVAASGTLDVTVDCTGAPCSGTVELLAKVKQTTRRGRRSRTRTVPTKIAGASFSDLPVGVHRVALKLGTAGRALLRHAGYKLATTARARYLSSGTTYALATGAVELKGKKKSKKKG